MTWRLGRRNKRARPGALGVLAAKKLKWIMPEPKPELLESMQTQTGVDLKTLSDTSPVLLVFLRHFG